MEFLLLGPLEVVADGESLPLGGMRQRALLALLLLHRNEVVSTDRIVDALWPAQPPKTAAQIVRVYVSQLRKALEPARSDRDPQVIVTRGSGYVLQPSSQDVDVDRFETLRVEGRRLLDERSAKDAADRLAEALGLWRGPPLQDLAYAPFAQQEIARLEDLRLAVLEDRFEAELASGRDSDLVPDLEALVAQNPLRERLRAQLMLALYRAGRQAEALEAYQEARRHLVDELGLEPSETLRRLEAQILRHDAALERRAVWPRPAVAAPTRRSRRLVVGALAVTALGVAAAALLLVAATGSGSSRRIPSLRIVLVNPGNESLSPGPVPGGPIDGLRAAAEDLGVQTKVVWAGVGDTRFLRALDVAARTSDLVVVGATPDLEGVSEVTRRHPETQFLVPGSVSDPTASFAGQRNVTGVAFDDREDGYLGGYLAGLMAGRHAAVSAIGGLPTMAVRNLISGYVAGVHRARRHLRVLVDYSQTFVDQHACETIADRQIDRGSAVVFDVAGDCGFGALQAAGIRGVWGLGVDSDLSYLGPHILASVVKRIDRATQLAVTLFASGELPHGRDLRLDLASDSVGLVGISDQVPQSVRAKVEALASELRARDQAASQR